jgi:hypothetical protein
MPVKHQPNILGDGTLPIGSVFIFIDVVLLASKGLTTLEGCQTLINYLFKSILA